MNAANRFLVSPPTGLKVGGVHPCADHDDPACEACVRGESDPHCDLCDDRGYVTTNGGQDEERCECNQPSSEPEDYLDADDGEDIDF